MPRAQSTQVNAQPRGSTPRRGSFGFERAARAGRLHACMYRYMCAAAGALKAEGATNVVAYCTHPVLSGKAVLNVESSELNELVVTDTIPLSPEAESCNKIRQLSVSEELAESIRRISNEESLSALFDRKAQTALF